MIPQLHTTAHTLCTFNFAAEALAWVLLHCFCSALLYVLSLAQFLELTFELYVLLYMKV